MSMKQIITVVTESVDDFRLTGSSCSSMQNVTASPSDEKDTLYFVTHCVLVMPRLELRPWEEMAYTEKRRPKYAYKGQSNYIRNNRYLYCTAHCAIDNH